MLGCGGVAEIPIEERDNDEVAWIEGQTTAGRLESEQLFSEASPAENHAFDVTPGRLLTGLITEKGICDASGRSWGGCFKSSPTFPMSGFVRPLSPDIGMSGYE
jgi:methylthioribose-1-phosphate isomerase